MVFTKAVFVKSAADESSFPKDDLKRMVFVGRSNVGKSSTINSIVGKKNFARVSSVPGKTVFVNLFKIDGKIWLVDLPGYGYSKTSKQERERYSALIDRYFELDRDNIARIYMIVDARHKPTADDVLMADWIKAYGLPATVIANKLDKLKKSEVVPNMERIRETLGFDGTVKLIPFSAEKHTNREMIYKDILEAVEEKDGRSYL